MRTQRGEGRGGEGSRGGGGRAGWGPAGTRSLRRRADAIDAPAGVFRCVCVCVCVRARARAPCVYLCIGGSAGPGCCGQYEASAGGREPAAVAAALR